MRLIQLHKAIQIAPSDIISSATANRSLMCFRAFQRMRP
ncbi:hypothetical protein PEDI_28470 [Persicobacter diffluens]|uniref:Uncharacterized protein n=1 Tax=Persicobacter diffluens TaxID=981 RepID=A0AAN4W0M0_9BACT|nr:hypothetical protein PEDI_28470 [Persicobacter diffluens]